MISKLTTGLTASFTVFSWILIIFFILLFFPFGLFLLYKKLSVNKTAIQKKSISHSIWGWLLITLGIFYIIIGLYSYQTDDPQTRAGTIGALILVLVVFIGGGLILVFKAAKLKKASKKNDAFVFSSPPSTIVDEAVIQPAAKVIACKNCGATNTIQPGAIQECEFCGSPLQ